MERLTEFKLRPGRVIVCGMLNPFRLVRLAIQRQAVLSPSPELGQISSGFTLVLCPSPESDWKRERFKMRLA